MRATRIAFAQASPDAAARRLHARRRGGIAALAILVACGWIAASARADSIAISVQSPNPEQGIPANITVSGTASPVDNEGDGPVAFLVARPAGGIGCQSSYENDSAAAGSASTNLLDDSFWGGDGVSPGNFGVSTTFDPPDTGPYLLCAWLENENLNPPAVAATSATFSAIGPQVSQLSVGIASPALPGVGFQIDYTTQTDQQLWLDSIIKPAGGLPCAPSYEIEQAENQSESDTLGGGASVFGGPMVTTTTETEQSPGPYVICSWIEGPNQGEVNATTSTGIYVGTPPPPPAAPPPAHPTPPAAATDPAYPGLSLHHVSVSVRNGVSISGGAASALSGYLNVTVACHNTERTVAYVAGGGYTVHVHAPHGCQRGNVVHVSVRWTGSASFSGELVATSVRARK